MRGQPLPYLHLKVFSGPSTKDNGNVAHVFFFYLHPHRAAAEQNQKEMKTNLKSLIAAIVFAMSLSSCATLFTKSHQDVTFKGVPGTTIMDKDKNTKIAEVAQNGFGTAKMKKQLKGKNIEATKDGYQPKSYHMGTKIQGAFWGNLIFGGIPGGAIDAATGKMMKFKDELIDLTLQPLPEQNEPMDAYIVTPVPEQRVDRNNAGATDMEKTILRWFFDSDPRGARIYMRVISNVPAEVKNTNETYLTTTPLEETRSFNIPGLTYENANDVTIEIKVTKRGYEDQVKRYNVRQAIDQQEISGFFELVTK